MSLALRLRFTVWFKENLIITHRVHLIVAQQSHIRGRLSDVNKPCIQRGDFHHLWWRSTLGSDGELRSHKWRCMLGCDTALGSSWRFHLAELQRTDWQVRMSAQLGLLDRAAPVQMCRKLEPDHSQPSNIQLWPTHTDARLSPSSSAHVELWVLAAEHTQVYTTVLLCGLSTSYLWPHGARHCNSPTKFCTWDNFEANNSF